LQRKLIVAIAERDKQVHAFAEVNKTVDSSVKKMWKDLIDAWLEDESKPNPYTLNRKGTLQLSGLGGNTDVTTSRLPYRDAGAVGGEEG
jgi:hypothetical protein